ncbi:type II toxin-antitoxin system RelB/DinJ family antitoxin [Candidatus Magnetominusculus xianensis]|uniref:Addiction module antitoxin, RelB/DinJ family n=1 Tax=Candidatus Magnetominusculus xianensis TaxID=1748249 RepID=A0ABR5SGN9_9BACT|nr:type II toxin-antitoxin system RelB/DinJ family antitoxin [Candidatus Magnetominusculus xianensis]KWT90490.1 addiction module antitoxin, RelB/DinJ family [Candidatus Magnetominusculus xianensis]MBF0404184.1 type II toxin-antitoxin system RelB/DinJ family antitoxin [Nitrospirota bacterium]
MSKTAMIRARTEPALKKEAEGIFKELGISNTEAINLFYRQVALRKGLPFEVKIPNKTTIETFRKTDRREDLTSFESVDDLLKDLDIHK